MIGRIVSQTHRQADVVGNIHPAPHALGPSTLVLRAMIQVDDQGGNVGKPLVHPLPPPQETIDQTITGHCRGDPIQQPCIQRRQGEAHWGHGRLWGKVMVGGNRRDAALATPRTRTDFARRFGIPREA
jgi:hypothetical protein